MAIAKHKKGELNPYTPIGFATITEHVVLDVLGDATKEKFLSSYDLISKSLGKINVKYSSLHRENRTHVYWRFTKTRNAKIPDYYICLGMDTHATEIIRVWIIPGESVFVKKRGIIISTYREERFKMYSEDPLIYDRIFQEMNIKDKPEFRYSTQPKVNEYMYVLKKLDMEMGYEEI